MGVGDIALLVLFHCHFAVVSLKYNSFFRSRKWAVVAVVVVVVLVAVAVAAGGGGGGG